MYEESTGGIGFRRDYKLMNEESSGEKELLHRDAWTQIQTGKIKLREQILQTVTIPGSVILNALSREYYL
jgi:hypothetical protein